MKIIECEQRSVEWDRIRGVIPTASNFDKLLTPTGKPSKQADVYMNGLLSHWLMGHGDLDDGFTTKWIDHGIELEDTAVSFYELANNLDVQRVGFCLSDNEQYGCSPDGLVGDTGGLEIKCPKGSTHIAFLKRQKIPTAYIPQVQGSMLVTGRPWWDFMSYHEELPPLVIRVYRDNEYLEKLGMAINRFYEHMIQGRIQLMELGYAAKNI